jgi:subtilisin family serine protease
MKENRFPSRYYLYLGLIIISIILIWYFIINNYFKRKIDDCNNNYPNNLIYNLPENGKYPTIDTNKIIIDSLTNRKIISNIVNIALKKPNNNIYQLVNDIKNNYDDKSYKIVYIDTTINRLQIEIPENERVAFKKEIKNKLNNYQILIWDETIFNTLFNDPIIQSPSYNWYIKKTNIENIWNLNQGNPNVIVAVIDNGFDLNHPELKNKYKSPYNVIQKNNNVQPNLINHGTHVASIIVANPNNNEGLVGICPNCSFMPIKIEDQNNLITQSYLIDGILYAIKNNANIINISLGMQIQMGNRIPIEDQKKIINSTAKDEEEFWNDLFKYANDNNITCVIAAGNNNILTGIDPFQRAQNTIKVGAIDDQFQKTNFSNYGPLTTIYAPGDKIIGAKQGGGYELLSGTSMAAPIISGYIGLLKSKRINITNNEIINILKNNAINKNHIPIFNAIM